MNPRTIDNLGLEASQRYAENQKFLEGQTKIHKEAVQIPGHTQIDVTKPTFHAELDQLFQANQKNLSWAEFHPPLGYNEQKRHCFLHQLLPSLKEKHETYIQKIEEQQSHKEKENDDEREKEQQERERKALQNLLDCILQLDTCMLYVTTKRSQYHKG